MRSARDDREIGGLVWFIGADIDIPLMMSAEAAEMGRWTRSGSSSHFHKTGMTN